MTSSEEFGGAHPTVGEAPLSGGYPAGAYVPPAQDVYAPPVQDIYRAPTPDDQPSTADVAKGQAASVAGGAADAAQHVAGVAKEQVGQVAAEASNQVKNLVGQARTELSSQAQSQQERAAGGLHSVGDQLRSLAEGSPQPGVATDLAQQASDRVHQIAGWLESRDPAGLLDDVRSFARQRPGVFLALALGAGVLAGRLARGITTDPNSVGRQDAIESGARSQPAPAALGYSAPVGGGYVTGGTGDVYGAGYPASDVGNLR